MSDPITEFLTTSGLFPKRQELVFNRNFLDRQSIAIPYEDMPKQYQEYLDDLAVIMLDPDGSKIIVTGNPMVGKTFLIEQFYANRDVFLKRAGQLKLEFVNVPIEHARLVEGGTNGRWQDYIEITERAFETDIAEMIYVTESVDAAIGLSGLGARVILELSVPTLHHLQKHESSGMVKQWASWQIIDLNDIYLNKNDLIQQLSVTMLDKVNSTYPELQMTRKHIALFVNYAVKHGELLVDADMDEERQGMVCVQPGIFARAIGRLASLMAISSEVRDKNGKLYLGRAIKRTFTDFEGIFYSCLEEFAESMSEMDDDDIESAIKNMLEEQIPGVRIMSIQSSDRRGKTPGLKGEDKSEIEFGDFKTLHGRLSRRVLGQETALSDVVEGLKIPAAGLNLETKPLRSFLFLGPTGVGKTELALSLAKELMVEEIPHKRVDLSEFGQEHEAAKLFGAPPGYTGHDEGGILTNFVKENPRSVIILDEVEKAHPKVWDSFLQILDAGRMTDGKGHTVDFTNTIVIMTSNIGADKLNKQNPGFISGNLDTQYVHRNLNASKTVTKAVENTFRPELVNRIDQLVFFNELPQSVLRGVIAKEIGLVTERISKRGYTLAEPKSDILDYIANMADASKYGAREVQRVIGKNVYNLLADTVLAGQEKKGLKLALRNGKLTVQARTIGQKDDSTVE